MDQEETTFEKPDPSEDKSVVPTKPTSPDKLYRRQRAKMHRLLIDAGLMFTETDEEVLQNRNIKNEDDDAFIVSVNPVQSTTTKLLSKFYVAGGTLTSLFTGAKVNDIDLFFKTEDDLEEMKEATKESGDYQIEHISPSAVTLQPPAGPRIQLIQRYIGAPADVIGTFDFTISQAAYDPTTQEFTFGKDFFRTLAEKVLVFNEGSRFPISSLWRAKKFMSRGYTFPSFEMLKICMGICNLHFDTMASVAEQISVVDPVNLKELAMHLMKMTDEPFDGDAVIKLGEEVLREEAFYE